MSDRVVSESLVSESDELDKSDDEFDESVESESDEHETRFRFRCPRRLSFFKWLLSEKPIEN